MASVSLGRLVAMELDVTALAGTRFDISVLLPTRGRGKLAERSLLSLIDRAKDNSRVEYRVALDSDDKESKDYFEKTIIPAFKERDINFLVITTQPLGYTRLNEYVNHLGKYALGRWLMFWNDDAVMETDHWDEIIATHTDKFRVLRMREQSDHPYAIFPIVPKEWYYLLGTLSNHQMSDAQISQIGYMCNIVENIDVHCKHDRFDLTGNNNDETYNNRPQLEGNPDNPNDLNSPQTIQSRYDQALRIMWYLNKTGQGNDHLQQALQKKEHMWKYLKANDPNGHTKSFQVEQGKQVDVKEDE